jgi:hypothetical protein
MRRHFDEDVWVKSLERYISRRGTDGEDHWAIPDVRFPNEVEAVKRMRGFVVRIDRDPKLRIPQVATRSHASEIALDGYTGWDYVINNDGRPSELYDQLETMCEYFKRRLKGG